MEALNELCDLVAAHPDLLLADRLTWLSSRCAPPAVAAAAAPPRASRAHLHSLLALARLLPAGAPGAPPPPPLLAFLTPHAFLSPSFWPQSFAPAPFLSRLLPLLAAAPASPALSPAVAAALLAALDVADPASAPLSRAFLFTLTYGAIVRQLLTDLEEVEEVNKQLDQMGYNIGTRLVDDFLAKSNVSMCVDFKETADVIAKLGFKMFLGVTATVTNWDAEGTSCSFVLEDNPLVDFVELPDTCQGLHYCNVLSGVIRGALEMVSMKTEVTWVRDMLCGDDAYEMRVKLTKQVPEEYPYKDDD